MGKWLHRLSKINEEKKTAFCSYCREIVKIRISGKNRRCINAYKETRRKRKNRTKLRLRELKLKRGCENCGYKKHYAALDWHHINKEDKLYSIPEIINFGYGWDRIKKELDKCIVLCANCHRVLTIKKISPSLDLLN